jgi:hypothetical protein
MDMRCHFETRRLARRRSRGHFAVGRRVPACGGQRFGVSRSGAILNRPSRPLARPPLQMRKRAVPQIQGRSDMRGCEGRLRVGPWPKLLCIGRGWRETFSSSSHRKCRRERHRVSPRVSRRQFSHLFEQGHARRRGIRHRSNLSF